MDKARKKRLEAAGWKFGSVAEFLKLSDAEAAYIEIKLALSKKLNEQRKSRKLTQGQLAEMLQSSQSRVAKMEAGDPSVSLDLLIRSLLEVGVPPKALGRIVGASVQG